MAGLHCNRAEIQTYIRRNIKTRTAHLHHVSSPDACDLYEETTSHSAIPIFSHPLLIANYDMSPQLKISLFHTTIVLLCKIVFYGLQHSAGT